MKQLFKKGEEYSFLNRNNILVGFFSSLTIVSLTLFIIWLSSFFVNAPQTDAPRPFSALATYTILLVYVFFILGPAIYMGKRHGWKSAISVFFFETAFLIVLVLLLERNIIF